MTAVTASNIAKRPLLPARTKRRATLHSQKESKAGNQIGPDWGFRATGVSDWDQSKRFANPDSRACGGSMNGKGANASRR